MGRQRSQALFRMPGGRRGLRQAPRTPVGFRSVPPLVLVWAVLMNLGASQVDHPLDDQASALVRGGRVVPFFTTPSACLAGPIWGCCYASCCRSE